MNYKEYMKSVEERLSIMTEEEKTKWIYNKARTAKEYERNMILNSLDEKQDFNPHYIQNRFPLLLPFHTTFLSYPFRR